MIKVYFVRHAEPDHGWKEDRTRKLTSEGEKDAKVVFEFFKDKSIEEFYCSPYTRSLATIEKSAKFFEKEIVEDERFRERGKGANGNNLEMFKKRWENLDFHEEGGESIMMVQRRNIEALEEILSRHEDKCKGKECSVVIGTHGTALGCILNHYYPGFQEESFLRIIDWMPYVIELGFDGGQLVHTVEHLHIHKKFKGI